MKQTPTWLKPRLCLPPLLTYSFHFLLGHLLTYSLTYSVTYLPTPSPTLSPTHLLPHLLCHFPSRASTSPHVPSPPRTQHEQRRQRLGVGRGG